MQRISSPSACLVLIVDDFNSELLQCHKPRTLTPSIIRFEILRWPINRILKQRPKEQGQGASSL